MWCRRPARALREFRIAGVATNIPFIQAVLAHPDFAANRIATDFIDVHVAGAGRSDEGNGATAVLRSRRCRR